MNLSRILRSAAACVLAVLLLCPTAFASETKSASVISVALGEVGSTEGPDEYSKYGEWYGLPNSYWCDMFVSWCAMAGNVPSSKFPRHCSCTEHVKRFISMGRYEESMARGNTYIPQQGDVIFFYNNTRYPSGSVKNHTGLVLYVEDGYVYTIEGNALANRLDVPYSTVSELRDGSLEPPDYVTVNRYPLSEPRIHGYGLPAYDDRTPLQLEGFVDLGRHAGDAAVFQSLCNVGVMSPTSTHTFSPNHGMTRADFIAMTTEFFGLLGCDPETAAFDDVPPESSSYAAVMSARSAGLVNGADGNNFLPDMYITPAAAQTVLNRALAYVGLEEQEFSFSEGDYSYMISSYTIRADIAKAFDTLCREMPLSEDFDGEILLDGAVQDWPVRCLDSVCYVPVEVLQQAFTAPELPEETDGESDAGQPAEEKDETEEEETEELPELEIESEIKQEDAAEDVRLPVPMGNTGRVIPAAVELQIGDAAANASGFTYRGTLYVSLPEAAELLSLDMEQGNQGSVALTAR